MGFVDPPELSDRGTRRKRRRRPSRALEDREQVKVAPSEGATTTPRLRHIAQDGDRNG